MKKLSCRVVAKPQQKGKEMFRNLIIACESAKEEKEVLKKLEKQDYLWDSGVKPTKNHTYWPVSYAIGNKCYLIITSDGRISWTITKEDVKRKETTTAKEFLKECKECIVIYRNASETIAIDQSVGKKAVAKCHPDDTYDFYTGAKLAVERLTEPEYYNGKVVCVDLEERHKHLLTKGKVYEFVDGILTYDNGSTSISKIKSFEEIKEAFLSEFIELVE